MMSEKNTLTISNAVASLLAGKATSWSMDNNDYKTLIVEGCEKPIESEINTRLEQLIAEQPLTACKDLAKEKIAITDWAALPDVGLKNAADFVTYRGILRGLIISPVADPVWPTEPTPIWE